MRVSISIFFLFTFFYSQGQVPTPDYKEVNMGLLYVNHVYYSFEKGVMASDTGKTWEIGFSVPGLKQGGIFINEYAERDMRPAIMQGPFLDFNLNTPPIPGDTLRNSEVNWLDGAFNEPNNTANPIGWGTKNTAGTIIGDRTYVIALPDGGIKKFMVDSLSSSIYSFKYANLDGSDLRRVSVDMDDFDGKVMAHYSMQTHQFVGIEPEEWDLLFTRVNDLATIVGQPVTNYNVTSVLTRHGVKTVELFGVDPETVDTVGYMQDLVYDNDLIGHDWKTFNLSLFEWELDPGRCYFVKLPNNCVWKFYVIDFEGAFSGIAYLAQANHGKHHDPVALVENNTVFEEFTLFPNPVTDQLNITFSLKQNQSKIQLLISNLLGQVVYSTETNGIKGSNTKSFQQIDLPTGNYTVQLYAGNEVISEKLAIVK